MARFDRLTVLNKMIEIGMVPVFYNGDVEVAKKIALACSAGGAKVLEFTNRGDFAIEVFKELSQFLAKNDPSVILGAGSVQDQGTAALYMAYGANFIVSPSINPETARVCNRRKVAYSPGCGSTTEMGQAEELGVEIVKVFPGSSVGGPGFVKAILGPTPWTRIMPTGGVEPTEESLKAWFGAGVSCVGMGSNLVSSEVIKSGDYEGLTKKTAETLALIAKIRGKKLFTGIEHVGIYPHNGADAKQIADWYEKVFGMKIKEGTTSIFAESSGAGRIEIMRAEAPEPCHVAISVSNFEAAVAEMRAKGMELEEIKAKADVKAVWLKDADPAGNRVHLLWRA